jgi:tRNA pseudouridine55 synthase
VGKSKAPGEPAQNQLALAKLVEAAFLNINKPKGITSHDVVARLRRIIGIKQIGHGGTLDPMAEGVMTIALGKACRLLRFLPDDKTYKATIRLGLITDTDDIEGKVLAEDKSATDNPPSRELVAAALLDFKGDIEQIPPYFSAIHVDGQRLYELARKGQPPPDIKARPVTIHSIDLLDYQAPEITIRVHCSKGTYIRSIARDLGQKLGPGGTLSGLVRESAGKFQLMQSADLGDNNLLDRLVTVEEAVALPQMTMPTSLAKRLALGQKIALSDLPPDSNHPGQDAEYVLVLGADTGRAFCAGRLGLSEIDGQPYIAPEVVFADV